MMTKNKRSKRRSQPSRVSWQRAERFSFNGGISDGLEAERPRPDEESDECRRKKGPEEAAKRDLGITLDDLTE